MKLLIPQRVLTALFMLFSGLLVAQTESTLRDNALRIYFDCNYCDTEHIKKELTFVNYVRDRKDAQVHILTTFESTGSGGQKQTFYIIGQREFSTQSDTLFFSFPSDATPDEVRRKQIQLLKMGLVRYVAKTPYAEKMVISYGSTNEDNDEDKQVTDNWNSWVFRTNASCFFDGEKSYKSFMGYGSISAQRVTEGLKTEFRANYNYSKDDFVIDDEVVSTTSNNKSFNHLLVKSINNHWSYGYNAYLSSSLFQNIDISTKLYPSVEYNLFPYSESSRRQLRFLYGAGFRQFNYIDTTIYNKTKEFLWGQSLGVAFEMVEKWGSITTSVEGSHYFHNVKFKRVNFYTSLEVRLFKGLSLSIDGAFSLVHDQLNLPKSEVSSEDILLKRKQLASQYNYWGSVGLSYSFGSIYNNVVNPRFGN